MADNGMVQAALGLELIHHAIKLAELTFVAADSDPNFFREYLSLLSDIEDVVLKDKERIHARSTDV